jgi:hypothetical protein
VFFAAGKEAQAAKLAGRRASASARQLDLIEQGPFELLLDRRFPVLRI